MWEECLFYNHWFASKMSSPLARWHLECHDYQRRLLQMYRNQHIGQSEVLIESLGEGLVSWGGRDIPGVSRQGFEIWCVEQPISNILNHIRPNAFEISSSSLRKLYQIISGVFTCTSSKSEKLTSRNWALCCYMKSINADDWRLLSAENLDTWRASSWYLEGIIHRERDTRRA